MKGTHQKDWTVLQRAIRGEKEVTQARWGERKSRGGTLVEDHQEYNAGKNTSIPILADFAKIHQERKQHKRGL